MSAPESLEILVGPWTGKNRLWLSPNDPVRKSDSIASVSLVAHGKFITVAYTWAFDGKPQDGLLLLGHETKEKTVKAVWIDSWHMGDRFMICEGGADDEGIVSVKGLYSAPPGPDWGWRTVVDPKDGNSFEIIMYNVTPDGEEELAVEATYERRR